MPEKEVIMTEIISANATDNVGIRLPERDVSIDHGWSFIKTPNFVFENGVQEFVTEPATKDNLLGFHAELRKYALGIEEKIRELKIDFDFTNIIYVGGGAAVMQRFGKYKGDNVRYYKHNRYIR